MLHTIRRKQILKANINTVWEFISNPANLGTITPPHMNFQVLSDIKNKKMYPGQIIEYFVSPFKGIKTHWVTEITHVSEGEFFVDEQRIGPYSFWHHQHHLNSTPRGIEMIDIVSYKLPLGFMGRLINMLVVRKKLDQIFDFREKKLEEIFNINKQ